MIKDGRDDTQPERQRYRCHGCGKRFNDLSGTILAGHHQPLRVWVLCLYFMGLNLSNEQIAQELGIDPDDAQVMTSQLRLGIVERQPEVVLAGEVECDEVYVVAGHKGHPDAVENLGRQSPLDRWFAIGSPAGSSSPGGDRCPSPSGHHELPPRAPSS